MRDRERVALMMPNFSLYWKARASEKLGIMRDRERVALQYNEKLKEKYGQHPLVSRIARHRQVPKHVKSAAAEIRSIKESSKRKEANRRRHSKPGSVPYVPEIRSIKESSKRKEANRRR